MPRQSLLLAAIILAAPAAAETKPPYYGPAKPWHGVAFAFKFGYQDKVEKNGDWRVDASIRGGGEALDMAMYRAAERARDAGYRYVQFLRGTATSGAGMSFASVRARPATTADAPAGCKAERAGGCYTADVAEVLRRLGGPGGTQPGVAIVDHLDKYGRPVSVSGFGIGAGDGRVVIRRTGPVQPAATPLATMAAVSPSQGIAPRPASATIVAPAPMTINSGASAIEAQARFDAALRAEQPVRGRDNRQGWTISD